MPPCLWFLARVAAAWIVEDEGGSDAHVRLGLDIMYEVPPGSAVAQRPTAWEAIPRGGEAHDLVAIHNALNQAAAQMESALPQRRGSLEP